MSSELIGVQALSSPPQPDRKERGLRLRVWIRRRALDRAIAAGAGPDADPGLGLRAQQLISTSARRRLAACLMNILEAADERHADPASRLELNHAEILAARHEIVALVEVLRSDRAVTAPGMALAMLLIDNNGPLLRAGSQRTVRQAVSEVMAALEQ